MRRLIDLSHTVEHGMLSYKGLPAPIICDFLSREASEAHYAEGTTFHIGKIEMVANTGTYLDSPFHRYAHGKDLSELALGSIADLEGLVFRADPGQSNEKGVRFIFRPRSIALFCRSSPAKRARRYFGMMEPSCFLSTVRWNPWQ